MKIKFFILMFFASSHCCFSQSVLDGVVKNKKGEPVFAANVYLKSTPEKGVTTDFDGNFSLRIKNSKDILIVSFLGYKTTEIVLSSIDIDKKVVVILNENIQILEEVVITKAPISEQISVVKMEKMDIYLNPVAQADPLKAITTLPASTNTDETANVSLRGSSPDRSRVMLNGVPIYKPTRANNISNQGFFSLFNTEIIGKQYVYASSPPLIYGNTSAGLVEIQTIRNLEANQLQLSSGLASVGFFLSQRIKKDISFIQVYGNYQFSDAYTGIQKKNLPNIKSFYTKDTGINFHTNIGKRAEFNSYNYYINETFNGVSESSFNYKGDVKSKNKRFFSVNNFKYYAKDGVLSINSGVNTSNENFNFGNIKSEQKIDQIYSSLDYRWYILESTNIQFGISHDFQSNEFNGSIPDYYYALSPNSPKHLSETSISNDILEVYFYTNWNITDNLNFSSGVRRAIPVNNQKYYLSGQSVFKYQLSKKHSFLLSRGTYHNYSTPSFYSKEYNLLKSNQLSFDYSYQLKNTLLKAAAYSKNETGEQKVNSYLSIDKTNTLGIELFLEHSFYKYFKFTFANSFINQTVIINDKSYKGQKDFNYFIKTTLQYNNPKLFSLALTYVGRPGTYFNPITGSFFNEENGIYKPIFDDNLYSSQYKSYNRLDLSLSKYTRFKKNALVTFVSLNNIFNTKNESAILYNSDYSSNHFDYFQFRTVYFGVVWHLNY